jgi:hypothetical protein
VLQSEFDIRSKLTGKYKHRLIYILLVVNNKTHREMVRFQCSGLRLINYVPYSEDIG